MIRKISRPLIKHISHVHGTSLTSLRAGWLDFSTLRRLVPEENFLPLSQSQRENAGTFYPECGKAQHLNAGTTFPPHISTCRNDVGLNVPHRPCPVAPERSNTRHITTTIYTRVPLWDSTGCQLTHQEPAVPSPVWTISFSTCTAYKLCSAGCICRHAPVVTYTSW